MPDTTYQYTFSDSLNNGAEAGTISGSFTADYNTLLASGTVTVTTPEGTENFTITNANISKGAGDPNQFTFSGLSPDQSFVSLTYSSQTPANFDFGSFQTTKANVAQYGLVTPATVTSTNTTVCFCTGTLISTTRGDVAVETLTVGDVVMTSSGEHRSLKWIGHREVDVRNHPRPHEVHPICIAAHAFGEARPARDLYLSPGHAICINVVGEVMIPAGALVNGTTIVQKEVEAVTYWHVELDGGHNVIFAENLPCESYLEMGNRGFFADCRISVLHGVPDAPSATHDDFCRPFHQEGPLVTFVRARIAARAPALGWRFEEVPLANLYLLVDGRRVEPEIWELSARFVVPVDAKDVWLVSDASVPDAIGLAPDFRSLGVCIGRFVIEDGFGVPLSIPADDPRLCVGFHHVEDGPQRWTSGRARLPVSLWEECRSTFFLRVDLTRPSLPRWVAPLVRVENVPLLSPLCFVA